MAALAVKTLFTVDEFEAFADAPENADRRFELIHGEIVEKVPTEEHGIIVLRLGSRLLGYLEMNQIGGYAGVEIRHQLPADRYNARMPDLSYRKGGAPVVTKGSVPQMPDLSVEVKSPDDKPRELREKASYYLTNGSRLVWLVYPETQTVEVCTLNAEGKLQIQTRDAQSTLDGGDVLPDFRLAVSDIFRI